MIVQKASSIVLEVVTDSAALAKARMQQQHLRMNSDWLQAHIQEIYSHHRGKCICVAGRELFVADTAVEVLGMARSALQAIMAPCFATFHE